LRPSPLASRPLHSLTSFLAFPSLAFLIKIGRRGAFSIDGALSLKGQLSKMLGVEEFLHSSDCSILSPPSMLKKVFLTTGYCLLSESSRSRETAKSKCSELLKCLGVVILSAVAERSELLMDASDVDGVLKGHLCANSLTSVRPPGMY